MKTPAQQMLSRYREGYQVSTITSRLGKMITFGSLAVGGVLFVGGLIAYFKIGGFDSVAGLAFSFLGVCTALGGWWTGLLLSAAGQIMKSVIDTSVNTSVVLDYNQKESLMSGSMD